MFKKILVPMISDHFPENALKRACALSSRFGGELFIMSVFPSELFRRIEATSSHVLMDRERTEIREELIRSNREMCKQQYFKRAEEICITHHMAVKKIVGMGGYSDEILKIVDKYDLDSIVLEFYGESATHYSILEDSPVPVWIEHTTDEGPLEECSEIELLEQEVLQGKRSIIGVCSNRSPNRKVPELLEELTRRLDAEPHLVYVVEEKVLSRSSHGMNDARKFVSNRERVFQEIMPGIPLRTDIVQGNMVREALKLEQLHSPWLMIVGRIRERPFMLSLERDVKRRLAGKMETNLLLAR